MQKNLYVLKKYLHLHPQSGNKTPVMRRTLFYGVMVTRQILVLKFQVRALVEQQKIKKGLENYFPNLFPFL